MDFEAQVIDWIKNDSDRMTALEAVSGLDLNDWCIAAGFVRNLVWDKLHEKNPLTPLNDLDVVYFDPACADEKTDKSLERRLSSISTFPWSVKNQARMHERNCDKPYTSTRDAMSYWVEMETAVGVTLPQPGKLVLVAPFGIARLFESSITINCKRRKPGDFHARIESKQWLVQWPKLRVFA